MELKEKVCIITGGSRGIGLSIAKKLLVDGIKSIALFELENVESKMSVELLKEEYGERIQFYPTDVTNTSQLKENMDKFIEKYGTIDILVNNAGIISENKTELMININYKAVVLGSLMMIERVGKHKGGKGGTIVNIASIAGLLNGNLPIYCSTKHAVVSFTRNMEEQYDVTGVRVVAICPGLTRTKILEGVADVLDFTDPVERMDKFKRIRSQSPDNVAEAVTKILENGKTGEVWVVEDDLPPYRIGAIKNYQDLRI